MVWHAPGPNSGPAQVGTTLPVDIPTGMSGSANMPVPGLGHPSAPPGGFPTGPTSRLQTADGPIGPPSESATGTLVPMTMAQGLHHLLMLGAHDPQQLQQIQEQLIQAGFLNPNDTSFNPGSVESTDQTYYAYAKLLNQAIETKTPIQQVLQERIQNPNNTTGKRFWQEYQQTQQANGGPITKSFTTTSANLTDAPDAAAIARNQFESMLGREATPAEAQAFSGALTAYEQAHPQVTSGTESYDPATGQSTVKNETTSGGVNEAGASELAANAITSGHGAELAHTQGDQLYDLFASMLSGHDMSALGGPG